MTTPSPDLVRMERLGIATCQRVSDLTRLGPIHRERAGIWCRPKKTRRRRRATFIPLATVDALELDRWAETPITFIDSRWKAPIDRFRDDRYLYSPRGVPYTDTSLRARWMRWLRKTPQGCHGRWSSTICGSKTRCRWPPRAAGDVS